MDGYVTKSQFATIYGCSKAYVSQLVAAKRLVLNDDGKLVHVDGSLKLLNVTADPSKAGVKERWAAFREGRELPPRDAMPAAPVQTPLLATAGSPPAAAATPSPQSSAPASSAYHDARTLREQAQAHLAQIELARAQGRAIDGESTLRAIADLVTTGRSEIMMFRDRLAPLVAPITDMRKVYDLIDVECERLCERLATRCASLATKAEVLQ